MELKLENFAGKICNDYFETCDVILICSLRESYAPTKCFIIKIKINIGNIG
jgi:hypothetical protein